MISLKDISSKLPTAKTNEERKQRYKLFKQFDPNGNGFLSLAECDKGIRDVLQLECVYTAKPAIMQAFLAAKKAVKSNSKYGDDYIEWLEFRYFLLYLQQYFAYYQLFQALDTSGDRRISIEEFRQSKQLMASFGVYIKDMDREFKKIDTNNGGFILFDEFVSYCIKISLSLENDDDDE